MPTISSRTTIQPAATFNATLGSQYEFAPFDAKMEVAAFADKAQVSLTIFSGPDILAEPGQMVPFGAAEATPKVPDDYHWVEHVAKGDRLKVLFLNGNVAATILNWIVSLTPA
jgi:hypothetical protein